MWTWNVCRYVVKSYGGLCRQASACGNGQTKSLLKQQHWPGQNFPYAKRTLIVWNGPLCVCVSIVGYRTKAAIHFIVGAAMHHSNAWHLYNFTQFINTCITWWPTSVALAYIRAAKDDGGMPSGEIFNVQAFFGGALGLLAGPIEIEMNECGANFKDRTRENPLPLP